MENKKLFKSVPFWVGLFVGIVLFTVTVPFYHDMYIADLFTVTCICLNAFSSVLFAVIIYCAWVRGFDKDSRGIFLWFILIQAIGHGIFAMMSWGS